ncbi:hypothetical protein HHI36_020353 [Cryptolaemus montrouzieri]|uniref:Partial AB-hydrolase lipase domain-containing protein n=1 Tax=Cryptolaemus montrouzieri TaxID=559131 RepID=A0ABD2NB16_9CUCU
MSNSTKFVFVTCYLIVFSLQGITGRHPDFYLSIEKLVNKYGYPMENHEVTTEDGYILTMFRIPHGRTGTEINQKLVILVHGLYGQAEHFITNAMHNGSLAFLLADNGYDVWLMNSRGTQHGRKHIRLDPNESKFWNFSWHEIAMYDLPAKIDYMLQKTKKSKLHYIGHSQGGTIFYVLSAMKPEYQKKIQLASLLSPAGYGGHIQFPLFQYFGRHFDEIMRMVEKYNIYEFPNLGNSPSELLLNTCIDSVFSSFCLLVMRNFNGIVTPNVDLEMLPLILRFIPTAAMKQSLHYLQGVISGS